MITLEILEVPRNMLAVGDNVHVVWQENSGIEDIFYRRSLDAGNSFFNTENLSNNPQHLHHCQQ